jgi:hypothetical protein
MDTDPKQEDDFHKMDGSADPYAEDPCVVMVRDWPPLFAVHLQYQSTGEYLSVKKGVLVLTKNPYVHLHYLQLDYYPQISHNWQFKSRA